MSMYPSEYLPGYPGYPYPGQRGEQQGSGAGLPADQQQQWRPLPGQDPPRAGWSSASYSYQAPPRAPAHQEAPQQAYHHHAAPKAQRGQLDGPQPQHYLSQYGGQPQHHSAQQYHPYQQHSSLAAQQHPTPSHAAQQHTTLSQPAQQHPSPSHTPQHSVTPSHHSQHLSSNQPSQPHPTLSHAPQHSTSHLSQHHPASRHTPQQLPTLSHTPQQHTSVSHTPQQHTSVSHTPQQHTSLSHTPQQHTSLSHPPQQHTSLSHPPQQHTSLSHPPQQHTSLSHTPQQYTSLSHTPQHSLSHLSQQPPSSRYTPQQHASLNHTPQQLPTPTQNTLQHPNPSYTPQHHPTLSHTPQQHPTLNHPPQQHPTLSHTLQQHSTLSHTPQQHPTLSHTLQQHPTPSHTPQPHPTPNYTPQQHPTPNYTPQPHPTPNYTPQQHPTSSHPAPSPSAQQYHSLYPSHRQYVQNPSEQPTPSRQHLQPRRPSVLASHAQGPHVPPQELTVLGAAPRRESSAASTSTSHSFVQPSTNTLPARPHSVQPPSHPPRPHQPLTPHPAYQHHPTCVCVACRSPSVESSYSRVAAPVVRNPLRPSPSPSPRPSPRPSPSQAGQASPSVPSPGPRLVHVGPGPPPPPGPGVQPLARPQPRPRPPAPAESEVPAKRMRNERVESPVDLSVRTVRRSADSTAWQGEVDTEPEDCDSTARPRTPPRAPTCPAPRRTAVMPRVHFMPEFSVAQFYQMQQQQQQRHQEQREEQQQQQPPLSLPGMSTLPWARQGAVSGAGGQHSPLLPLFSSNRSSLYPSSTAPALPAHAADPTGYLIHGSAAPAPPVAPTAPRVQPPASPAIAPPARQESATTTTTEVESLQDAVPARIRTKAEMKMLGDATSKAVRSWIVSSASVDHDPVRNKPDLQEASPSGLRVTPEILATSMDAERDERSDALPAVPTNGLLKAGRDTSLRVGQTEEKITPCHSSSPLKPSSTTLSTDLNTLPSTSSVASLLSSQHEVESPESAWEKSCLDFELQLEASENRGTLKRRSHNRKSNEKISKSFDDTACISDETTIKDKKSVKAESHKEKRKVSKTEKTPASGSEAFTPESSPKRDKIKAPFSKKNSKQKPASKNDETDSSAEDEDVSSLNGVVDSKVITNTRLTRRNRISSKASTTPNNKIEKTTEHTSINTRKRSNGVEEKLKSKSTEIKSSPTSKDKSTSRNNSQEKSPSKSAKDKCSPNKSPAKGTDKGLSLENESLEDLKNTETRSVKIRLRTRIVEVEQACSLRPKGDGSDFRPGWEEEVFQYKRSLRMPHVLINMAKGPIQSEGECSKSSSLCSLNESAVESTPLKWSSRPASDIDSSSYCPDMDSEDASSSISVTTSVISRRNSLKQSIVDKLVEKVSKVSALNNKGGSFKNLGKKPLKPSNGIDKLKLKPPIVKEQPHQESKISSLKTKKTEDSLKSVFGADKVSPPKNKGKALGEKKFISLPSKKKSEPARQISLRKRGVVTKIPTTRKGSNDTDISNSEGIVLRPRLVQPPPGSRPGLRSAALVRRSKVVLNSKLLKSRHLKKQTQPKGTRDVEVKNQSAQAESKIESNDPDPCANPQPIVVRKRMRLRRKFRSGFDYIRKKKKVKKDDAKKISVPKVAAMIEKIPLTEEQIQATVRNWVINRSHGDTILHRAARQGYAEVAQYAIEKLKISPRVADNAGYTPLHEAARHGHVDLSKILLEHGADVSCSASGGVRPLHEAAESNEVEMLRLLLEYGADPTLATYSNQTPLSIVEPDSEAHYLLSLHLADVQGLPAPPWKYHGPSKLFDAVTYKDDYALQEPPVEESNEEVEVKMFSSEIAPPPLYAFYGETPSQFWVLIKDLMVALNIQSEEEMIQILSETCQSDPHSSQDFMLRTRELTIEEFLQRTVSITLCDRLSNLQHAGTARLVEYNCKVQSLLSEDVISLD